MKKRRVCTLGKQVGPAMSVGGSIWRQSGTIVDMGIMRLGSTLGRKMGVGDGVLADIIRTIERQFCEGVEIAGANVELILNSKLDYFQPRMKRITFWDIYEEFGS